MGAQTTPPMSRRSWALLLVLCGTIFLEGADVAMLGVAVPTIRADLGLGTGTAAWVMSGYVLGYAGFTLLGGRAADLLGRRRMFLLWLTVFVAFSGLGGFATEGWMLVAARFVTGVAAAFMTPAALSLITTSYPQGPARTRALMIYAGANAAGFSLGLVTGGLLTALGWRWVFFAPVLFAAALLAAALWLVPVDPPRPPRGTGSFDVFGAVTAAGAMLLTAYGVVRFEHGFHGWPLTVAVLAVGALSAVVFVRVERRAARPLVRLGIFRRAAMVRADLGALLFVGSFFGFQFVLTLYLQELRGWSTLQTAFALIAMGVDAVLAPTLTPVLVRRFGNAWVVLGGFVLATLSYGLTLRIGSDWSYAAMFPGLLMTGIAFAFVFGPLTVAATDGVDSSEQGLAGGLLTTCVQFGSAIGISSVTAVYGLAGGDARLGAFRWALTVPLGMALVGLALALYGVYRSRPPKAPSVGDPAPRGRRLAARA
ncbi:MFS transporter [Streptomyces sp. NPDC059578]|uniref:MFS transporter n=1 Tax=Streptomyces sp. NPDC059578 TaxID=3346874 RepID=UPI003693B1BD